MGSKLFQINPNIPAKEIVAVLAKHKVPYGTVSEVLQIVLDTIDTMSVRDLDEDREYKAQ